VYTINMQFASATSPKNN